MQNLLNKALWFIGFMVIIFIGLIAFYSEDSTKVIPKEGVDIITNRLYASLNVKVWETMTDTISWQREKFLTKWHKPSNKVIVQFENATIEMRDNGDDKKVISKVEDFDEQQILMTIEQRWKEDYFCLFGPYMIFEKNAHCSITPMEKGRIGLMLQNSNGDSYLWSLDEDYLPVLAKLISTNKLTKSPISIGWKGWVTMRNGLKIAINHEINKKPIIFTNVNILNVK